MTDAPADRDRPQGSVGASGAAGRTAVVVAGMHRSGTSAVAGTLAALGCALPRRLREAGRGNELGHWEPRAINALNDDILREAGTSWADWRRVDVGAMSQNALDMTQARIAEAVACDYPDGDAFVLKDPRICRLLPLWFGAIERVGAQARIVIPVRDPVEVAASLSKRDGSEPGWAHLVWLRHVLDAEAETRSHPRSFLLYADLMADWRVTMTRLARELGLDLALSDTQAQARIDSYLDAGAWHERADTEPGEAAAACPTWAHRTFEILTRWTRGEGDAGDQRALDDIRAALDAAENAFAWPVARGYEAQRALARVRAELAERDRELARTRDAVRNREQDSSAKEESRDRYRAALADREAHIARLEDAVAARDRRLGEFEDAMAARDRRLAEFEDAVATRDQRLEEARATIAQRDRAFAEVERAKRQKDNEAAQYRELAQRRAAAIEETRRSTSWRVTAPLRAASKAAAFVRPSGLGARLVDQYQRRVPHTWRARVPEGMRQTARRALSGSTHDGLPSQATPVPRAQSSERWSQISLHRRGDARIWPLDGAADVLARLHRCDPSVCIVIPVYNAPEELAATLAAVLRCTPRATRILAIDDASPDPAVTDVLADAARTGRVEVCRNEHNLGFSGTVNRGMTLAGRADVVVLNADAEVTPCWLPSLRIAAYSAADVATATPLSDNAGAFSVPAMGRANARPSRLSPDGWARAVRQTASQRLVETPTAHGFCTYIRRDCLDAVGTLDAEAFPRGYGEENDLCLRATRAGWRHVVDSTTLVYHRGAASFGESKAQLMAAGREIVDARYPEYTELVRQFTQGAGMSAVRACVQETAQVAETGDGDPRPVVLYLVSTRTGGTPQTNADLMAALSDRVTPLVLRCDSQRLTLSQPSDDGLVELESHRLSEPIREAPHRSQSYDAVLFDILVRYAVELMHVRHFAWHGLGMFEVARTAGVPAVLSFHDFYAVCPTVNLIDERRTYCAGACTQTDGDCASMLWAHPELKPLKHRGVHTWREQVGQALGACDAFVTTSEDTRRTLVEAYPWLQKRPFHVIPHGRDFPSYRRAAQSWNGTGTLRLLVAGNMSVSKGGHLLPDLCRHFGETLEVHLLGSVEPSLRDSFNGVANLIQHGPYARDSFAERVAEIEPHVGGVFSIWAETFCHVLTEFWAAGVPVVGVDLGAVGERIRQTGAGWLAAAPHLDALVETIAHVRDAPGEQAQACEAVGRWQREIAPGQTCAHMAHAYRHVYQLQWTGAEPAWNRARATDPSPAAQREVVCLTPLSAEGTAEATGYIRVLQPLTHPSLSDIVTVRHAHAPTDALTAQPAALLVQRDAINDPETARQVIDACAAQGCALIYEIDDDLLNLPPTHPDAKRFGPSAVAAMTAMARAADVVSVSTPGLRDRLAHLNPAIEVSANALDERLWQPRPTRDAAIPGDRDPVRILYMGSRTHANDLRMIEDALAEIRARFGERVEIHCIGGVPGAPPAGIKAVRPPAGATRYPAFARWLSRTGGYDIALAPLEDSAFNATKSHIKYLDYALCGAAPVVSDVSAYRGTVRHGITGMMVDNSPRSWSAAIAQLVEEPELRRRIAVNAQEDVLAHHTLAAQAGSRAGFWRDILQRADGVSGRSAS